MDLDEKGNFIFNKIRKIRKKKIKRRTKNYRGIKIIKNNINMCILR